MHLHPAALGERGAEFRVFLAADVEGVGLRDGAVHPDTLRQRGKGMRRGGG